MSSIQELAKKLSNDDAGWVNRRDAAAELRKMTEESIQILQSHLKDSDQDVRQEVSDALQTIKAISQKSEPVTTSHTPSLEKLVTALEKKGSREITQVDEQFEIDVILKEGRSQKILVSPAVSPSGNKLVQISTVCGEATEKVFAWALKSNIRFSHGALAINKINDRSMLVMVNSFLEEELSFRELKASVKEIAFYGDWVESKLAEEDIY